MTIIHEKCIFHSYFKGKGVPRSVKNRAPSGTRYRRYKYDKKINKNQAMWCHLPGPRFQRMCNTSFI